MRYFFPLPHDQQLLAGFGFEYNRVFGLTIVPAFGARTLPAGEAPAFAVTTLLPNLGIGWRTKRLTVYLDGQIYSSHDSGGENLSHLFLDSNGTLRFSVGYRLVRHPDDSQQQPDILSK